LIEVSKKSRRSAALKANEKICLNECDESSQNKMNFELSNDLLVEDETGPSRKKSKRESKKGIMIYCYECLETKPHYFKQMCRACYQRKRRQQAKLDESKKRICVVCKKLSITVKPFYNPIERSRKISDNKEVRII